MVMGGDLIDLMTTKLNPKDGETQTETHPFTDSDFKQPFVFKIKSVGEHASDVLSHPVLHMLSNC